MCVHCNFRIIMFGNIMKSHRSENDEANVFNKNKISIRLKMSEWECECELEWLGIYVNKFQSRTRAYNSMQHLSAIHFRIKTLKIPWVWQRFCFLCTEMWAVTPEWKFRTILAWKSAMFKDVIKGQFEGKLQTRTDSVYDIVVNEFRLNWHHLHAHFFLSHLPGFYSKRVSV